MLSILQGLKARRKLMHGEMNLILGNRQALPILMVGEFEVKLSRDFFY